MDEKELAKTALDLFNKGYTDWDTVGYSDKLSGQNEELIEEVMDLICEIENIGRINFQNKYGVH